MVSPYQRAVMFVDNAGADVVLGMIPFARELLRMGAEVRAGGAAGRRAGQVGKAVQCSRRPGWIPGERAWLLDCSKAPNPCLASLQSRPQVVLVANSLPAINDVTAAELRSVSGCVGAGPCVSPQHLHI